MEKTKQQSFQPVHPHEGGAVLSRIGMRLGLYEIVRLLGEGGMGEVYLAHDHRLGRMIALKLLPGSLTENRDRVKRFHQEARTASSFSHPNVATIYEIGESDGVHYIAMEYVEGQTLDEKMKGQALDLGQVVEIGLQAAEALLEAHSKGIVHRDIKPGNIMLTPRGQVKILDFGLAKMIHPEANGGSDMSAPAKTTPGLILGTVKYMSPEQALGRLVDHRTDLFSLGSVLYEIAAGRPPFTGDSQTEIIDQILHTEPEPIARYNPDIAPTFEEIIGHCLVKDREQRYPSALQLVEDLKSFKQNSKWRGMSRRGAVVKTLAVLPFKPLTMESRDEALEMGMADTLIIRLSPLRQVRVSSMGAVRKYRGGDQDPLVAGRELGVDAIMDGSLQRRGERLRVSVRLMSVRDGSTLWAGTFNESFTDIFDVQDSISERVAAALELKLTDPQKRQITKRYTTSVHAYELYLKAHYASGQVTEQGLYSAIDFYKQALEADPQFALALAGLADAYQMLSYFNYVSPQQMMPLSQEAALKALRMDETLAEAHAVLAFGHLTFDWNWVESERSFQRALELSPNFGHGHHQYAHFLIALGRMGEAHAESLRALELERLNLEMNTHMIWHFYYARKYDEALTHGLTTLEIEPNLWYTHLLLAQVHAQKGRYEESIAAAQRAIDLSGTLPDRLAILGYAYAIGGKREEAEKVLNQMNDLSKKRYVSPFFKAVVSAGLGEKDSCLEWLEKAYEDRSEPLVYLKMDPIFDLLRHEPRFDGLLVRIGLSQR